MQIQAELIGTLQPICLGQERTDLGWQQGMFTGGEGSAQLAAKNPEVLLLLAFRALPGACSAQGKSFRLFPALFRGIPHPSGRPHAPAQPCCGGSRVTGRAGASEPGLLVPSASRMDLSRFSFSAKEGNPITACQLLGRRDGDSSARPPLGAFIISWKMKAKIPAVLGL